MQQLLILLLLLFSLETPKESLWVCEQGKISFVSEAPLETIRATTNGLRGIIDIEKRSFAFSVPINSFVGFNSDLQREHFNENYMESNLHPHAKFTGKIIEDTDITAVGKHHIRAKGELLIHGVKKERILYISLEVDKNRQVAKSEFSVLLADHSIAIPKIVQQKINEEIKVTVEATFTLQTK